MGHGNSGSWSDGGSWSWKSYKSSNSWKNYLVCESCSNWVYEHGAQKCGFLCRSCGRAHKTPGTDPVPNAEPEIARGTGGYFDFNAVISACLNLLSKGPQTGTVGSGA